MDSLFDASLFDAKPAEPETPSVAGEGQLDIFGNVVMAETPAQTPAGHDDAPADEAEPTLDPLEALDLLGAIPTPADEDVDEPAVVDAVDAPLAVLEDEASDDLSSEALPEFPEPAPEPVVDADGARPLSSGQLWTGVIGQDEAVRVLQSAARRPVHAFLLTGPPGSGKRRAAAAFAAALLCPRGGCGTCSTCVRATAEVHPDLLIVEREGASITVDQAREIIRLAVRSPMESSRKVLVLEDFHLVTTAGPTLLKIIEEPPASTVFVILAELVTNDLITIASRCVRIPFAPLGHATVVAALVAEGVSPEAAENAAVAASGRLDRARLLANDPTLGARRSFWSMLPERLDGTGAAAAALAAEATSLLEDAAVAPLEERQARELAELTARLEANGARGAVGQRKELTERHKRELKRLRDDEVRFGLTILQQRYRDRAVAASVSDAERALSLRAVAQIAEANEQLVRNPNLALMIQALFVRIAP